MRKAFMLLAATGLLCTTLFTSCTETAVAESGSKMIQTDVPARPAGQEDMLQFAAEPIKNVRVAVIGLGMRGPGAVKAMTHIPGVEVVALCDVRKEGVERANKILVEAGQKPAQEFYGDTTVWRKVTALPDVDLVYVATNWQSHVKIGIQAMEDGKHVAIEVPTAFSLDDIWGLINTSERTRKHCMQLENCVYDDFELTTLNMVQNGVLGEVLHGEGAYIHGLQPFWKTYWKGDYEAGWRMDYNKNHRGDVYPTHGLGPVCQAMNIHRGNKMNYLVSVDTKAVGNPAYMKEMGYESENFKAGDHTSTLISTENGGSILIEHNVTSPRPYSRMYQLTGTKGFANKYLRSGYTLTSIEDAQGEGMPNIEKLDTHSFVPKDVQEALMKKYQHPIVKDIITTAKKVGGHGGMDFIMIYRLMYCLQNGLPLDMDVYDMAEWCCLVPLTEISLENGSAPVAIPDFTRGGWNKYNTVEFHLAK